MNLHLTTVLVVTWIQLFKHKIIMKKVNTTSRTFKARKSSKAASKVLEIQAFPADTNNNNFIENNTKEEVKIKNDENIENVNAYEVKNKDFGEKNYATIDKNLTRNRDPTATSFYVADNGALFDSISTFYDETHNRNNFNGKELNENIPDQTQKSRSTTTELSSYSKRSNCTKLIAKFREVWAKIKLNIIKPRNSKTTVDGIFKVIDSFFNETGGRSENENIDKVKATDSPLDNFIAKIKEKLHRETEDETVINTILHDAILLQPYKKKCTETFLKNELLLAYENYLKNIKCVVDDDGKKLVELIKAAATVTKTHNKTNTDLQSHYISSGTNSPFLMGLELLLNNQKENVKFRISLIKKYCKVYALEVFLSSVKTLLGNPKNLICFSNKTLGINSKNKLNHNSETIVNSKPTVLLSYLTPVENLINNDYYKNKLIPNTTISYAKQNLLRESAPSESFIYTKHSNKTKQKSPNMNLKELLVGGSKKIFKNKWEPNIIKPYTVVYLLTHDENSSNNTNKNKTSLHSEEVKPERESASFTSFQYAVPKNKNKHSTPNTHTIKPNSNAYVEDSPRIKFNENSFKPYLHKNKRNNKKAYLPRYFENFKPLADLPLFEPRHSIKIYNAHKSTKNPLHYNKYKADNNAGHNKDNSKLILMKYCNSHLYQINRQKSKSKYKKSKLYKNKLENLLFPKITIKENNVLDNNLSHKGNHKANKKYKHYLDRKENYNAVPLHSKLENTYEYFENTKKSNKNRARHSYQTKSDWEHFSQKQTHNSQHMFGDLYNYFKELGSKLNLSPASQRDILDSAPKLVEDIVNQKQLLNNKNPDKVEILREDKTNPISVSENNLEINIRNKLLLSNVFKLISKNKLVDLPTYSNNNVRENDFFEITYMLHYPLVALFQPSLFIKQKFPVDKVDLNKIIKSANSDKKIKLVKFGRYNNNTLIYQSPGFNNNVNIYDIADLDSKMDKMENNTYIRNLIALLETKKSNNVERTNNGSVFDSSKLNQTEKKVNNNHENTIEVNSTARTIADTSNKDVTINNEGNKSILAEIQKISSTTPTHTVYRYGSPEYNRIVTKYKKIQMQKPEAKYLYDNIDLRDVYADET